MTLMRDSAIVLRRLEYSETSQVLVLLTRAHGKVRAIAKGAKRSTRTRFSTGYDLLNTGTVVFSVRGARAGTLATLTEFAHTHSLAGLRERLDRLHAALYAAEISAALTEDHDPHPALFDALLAFLQHVCTATEPLGALVWFQRRLLNEIGMHPELERCVRCGRVEGLGQFSSHEGGVACAGCAAQFRERHPVSAATLRMLPALESGAALDEPTSAMAGPFRLYNYHLSHLMHREPAMARSLLRELKR